VTVRRQAGDARAIAAGFVDADQDRGIKRGYLRWLPADPLLDLGSGAGHFLDLLVEAGRRGQGVERAEDAAAACVSRGLNVECRDVFAALDQFAAEGQHFGSVLAAHLIEHLPGEDGARLVQAIARVLAPGGRVLFATPNPRNRIVLEETFWLDPTHVRPYPRALIVALCRAAGRNITPRSRV